MTFSTIYTDIARSSRHDVNNTAHLTALKEWVNRAQEEVEEDDPTWWFLEDEWEITTVASTRRYDPPTTNIDGATATLSVIDVDSVRVSSRQLDFVYPSILDREDRDWTDASVTAGSPTKFTTVGKKLALSIPPSSAWQSDNTKIYLRGWKAMPALAAATDLSIIPATWHQTLFLGGLYRAQQAQGDPDWRMTWDQFRGKLREMEAKCRPSRGELKRIGPPRIFRLSGRRSVNTGA